MTKITIDREAMRILIDELADGNFAICPEIMKMLDGAAQPADAQPVAWPTPEDIQRATEDAKRFAVLFEDAAPPVPVRHEEFSCPLCFDQPAPVPLTDERIVHMFRETFVAHADPMGKNNMTIAFARAIEAAHGIGDKP